MSGRVGCHGCWKNMESVCASPASAVAITTCRAAPSSNERPFAECTLQLWGARFGLSSVGFVDLPVFHICSSRGPILTVDRFRQPPSAAHVSRYSTSASQYFGRATRRTPRSGFTDLRSEENTLQPDVDRRTLSVRKPIQGAQQPRRCSHPFREFPRFRRVLSLLASATSPRCWPPIRTIGRPSQG